MSQSRRSQERQKVFFAGLIVSLDGSYTAPCMVRDLSPGGARLQLSGWLPIPQSFHLIVNGKNTVHEAVLAYVRGDEYRVRFTATYPPEALDRHDLQVARALLIERLPRSSMHDEAATGVGRPADQPVQDRRSGEYQSDRHEPASAANGRE